MTWVVLAVLAAILSFIGWVLCRASANRDRAYARLGEQDVPL